MIYKYVYTYIICNICEYFRNLHLRSTFPSICRAILPKGFHVKASRPRVLAAQCFMGPMVASSQPSCLLPSIHQIVGRSSNIPYE